ncbi:rho GTPase-activating protein, partial [Rhizopus stolonifer]
RDYMINFDKRRCITQFLRLVQNVQTDLDEQPVETKSINMSFLLSPNESKHTWKDLRELAARENKKQPGNLVLRAGPRTTVFNKLVTEQMEKLKRYFRDRDRIDKEWLSFQHKLQKKQLEQARQADKQDRKTNQAKSSTTLPSHQLQQHSVMPRINSFLKGLRPHSMAAFPPHLHIDHPSLFPHLSSIKASTVINLIHATTSVASTYTKRDFVFRIVTEEGGQYLLQGMSREDMQDWMQYINSSSREGAAKRQSVLAADSINVDPIVLPNTETRSKPFSRTSVFGVPLDSLIRDHQIPLVVDKCIQEIERRGLEEVGIYRVAGTGSVVSALKTTFNKDVSKVDLSDPLWADINVVADTLKQFLRELPEPLLTYTYYDELINAAALEDHDERVYLLKKIIKKLPYSNYLVLKRIIEHFVTVTDFEATNHMYATNLAIVFGPTLLQPSPSPTSFATTMSNIGHHQTVVKYLILNYHYLFDVELDEAEAFTKDEEQDTPSSS